MDVAATGLIFTIAGFAGLTGSLLTPVLNRRLSPARIITTAGAAWTAGVMLLVVARSPILLTAAWAFVALMMPVYFSTLYAYRVGLIPDALQGRVNSAYRVVAQAAAPAGVAAGGLC